MLPITDNEIAPWYTPGAKVTFVTFVTWVAFGLSGRLR